METDLHISIIRKFFPLPRPLSLISQLSLSILSGPQSQIYFHFQDKHKSRRPHLLSGPWAGFVVISVFLTFPAEPCKSGDNMHSCLFFFIAGVGQPGGLAALGSPCWSACLQSQGRADMQKPATTFDWFCWAPIAFLSPLPPMSEYGVQTGLERKKHKRWEYPGHFFKTHLCSSDYLYVQTSLGTLTLHTFLAKHWIIWSVAKYRLIQPGQLKLSHMRTKGHSTKTQMSLRIWRLQPKGGGVLQ